VVEKVKERISEMMGFGTTLPPLLGSLDSKRGREDI
jgi:hypothetical protein